MILQHILGQNPQGSHRIAYTDWYPNAPSTFHHPPLICVHGLVRNGRDFDRLATAFSHDTHVICPDIAGRGQSDWLPDPTSYNYLQYVQDMNQIIAHINQGPVDWIGTSMGGIIGMLMAASPDNKIRRLVINDIGPFIPLSALHRILAYIAPAPRFASFEEIEPYLQKIYASFGITCQEDWHNMALHSARTTPEGGWTLAYDPSIADGLAHLKEDVSFWESYDNIQCPVLVVRGANSDVLPHDVAVAMTERGPKAQLIEIANTGHAPALMDEEQILLIKKFLRT